MGKTYETIQHRWFEEVWNQGKAETIDELLAPDVVVHGIKDGDGKDVVGIEHFRDFYRSFRGAIPDIHIVVEDTVAQGDKLVGRCLVTGTHAGPGLGFAPTNKPIEFSGLCWVRVRDGQIAESWNNFDFLGLLQQLGAVKVPEM
jgi:steroid delta-isomerase-like uncharacterized protein